MSDIVCVGEILWDALPAGLFLGGAPFNVASHLHALGNEVTFASRVGTDVLGDEAVRRLRARGLSGEFVQKDDARPTGFVQVDLTATDDPDYEIVAPAAWDAITLPEALQQRTRDADALVFGSLAQRDDPSRRTVQRLADASARSVFDVNLRPPYVNRTVVERSLTLADVVKLNGDELAQLGRWFDLADDPDAAMAGLADAFDCRTVCVTWGDEGASLWNEDSRAHHPGHPVDVADTVGAGDAFLSAFLSGLLDGRDGAPLLDLANRLGAYVASHDGAFPPYEVDTLDALRALS